MMRYFLSFLCLAMVVSVQALTVEITEISPHKVNEQEEWFEFSISSLDPVDMSGWQIQNQKGTTKNFADFSDRLEGGHEELVYSGGGEASYFAWTKSPLSLANDGAEIILLNESEEILDQITYPKTKSGTTGGIKYAEIWNRKDAETLIPLIFRDDPNSIFTHTKESPNHDLPTLPEEIEILISEVSPQREDNDFIELVIIADPEEINLKYMTIKHNGTKLWEVESDLLVAPEDYIVIHLNETKEDFVRSAGKVEKYTTVRDGLSAGSGTIEVILFSGTSYETTVDFLCYKNQSLSQTELNRVEKNRALGVWSEECVEIGDQIENESVARSDGLGDSNTAHDWFRHFNGSPGAENVGQNQEPDPVIRVQGSGKTAGTLPFSLNLTGEDSIDPDGSQDIKSFIWSINGEIFSDRENPLTYKIEVVGDHEIELLVEDHSGATATQSLAIKTWEAGGGGSSFGGSSLIKQLFEIETKKTETQSEREKGFFDDFLAIAPPEFWENLSTDSEIVEITPEYHPQLTYREKLEFYHKEKAVSRNNLGMIFLES